MNDLHAFNTHMRELLHERDSSIYDLHAIDQQHTDLLAKLEREKLAYQANEVQLYQTINQHSTLLRETQASHAGLQQGLQDQRDEQHQ